MMTPRERLLTALRGGRPDRVPVTPDLTSMIPCRLTGKPSWDIYLFRDPPLWQAYIAAAQRLGIDGLLTSVSVQFPAEREAAAQEPRWQQAIVTRTAERILTRFHARVDGAEQWTPWCNVYPIDNPPTYGLELEKVGMSAEPPTTWEDVQPRTRYEGTAAYEAARAQMGDQGVVALTVHLPGLPLQIEAVYEYYDHPEQVSARCAAEHEQIVLRTRAMLALQPDLIVIGISGHMRTNPEPIFRQLSLPTLQAITRLCKEASVPTLALCGGPERAFLRIAAAESELTAVGPLEMPPSGDCDLAQVKAEFGSRFALLGNLPTTDVMLHGTPQGVAQAARQAIEAAAPGGGFVLSTGDECGRDTPPANIQALFEATERYGRY
jgi:uroporphyrinogen decarboxylase